MGEMIKAMERSPNIFSVSCKMIQLCHKELMDDAGDMYRLLGWEMCIRDRIAASIRQKFGTAVEIRAMRSNHLEMVYEG